ncbi:uncharacterized protein BJ171DRAFT_518366 [Polychytrium aggregatum]|uniref:uncharacterized protein n=1 Tax=Polychytrium aggregatum TaxID=110093 RepID=UPI0022FDF380|nr:uncharacterized protein BJ171DRAFT_518366 [Polychytrium aggregatum]KAI9199429.1 hypothetical protein BJ171DRAFT_518366 [Polychytrium aggregatum]
MASQKRKLSIPCLLSPPIHHHDSPASDYQPAKRSCPPSTSPSPCPPSVSPCPYPPSLSALANLCSSCPSCRALQREIAGLLSSHSCQRRPTYPGSDMSDSALAPHIRQSSSAIQELPWDILLLILHYIDLPVDQLSFAAALHNQALQAHVSDSVEEQISDFLYGYVEFDAHRLALLLPASSRPGLYFEDEKLSLSQVSALGGALQLTKLKKLRLSGCHIGDYGVQLLLRRLDSASLVKEMGICDDVVGPIGAGVICRVVNDCSLIELDLHKNELGNDGCISIAQSLATNTTLVRLILNECGISTTGMITLFNTLQTNRTLTRLEISKNRLSDYAAASLAMCLILNDKIEKIDISNNSITPNGMNLIGDGLRVNKGLKSLDVSFNEAGDHGVVTIAESLIHNTTLEFLLMSNCAVKPQGAARLAAMLARNIGLQHLDLRYNLFGNEGGISLVQALEFKNELEILKIGYCGIDEAGCFTIGKLMAKVKNLHRLLLSGNRIGDYGVLGLVDGLMVNKTLKSLVLCGRQTNETFITDEGLVMLRNLALANQSLQDIALTLAPMPERTPLQLEIAQIFEERRQKHRLHDLTQHQ